MGIVVGAGAGAGVGVSAGTGADIGASAGMLIEAVHKHQSEVAAPKYVYTVPYRVLRN